MGKKTELNVPGGYADGADAGPTRLSFAVAFKKWVLDGSEMITAREQMNYRDRYDDLYSKAAYPGLLLNYRWPLDLTAKKLASDFISRWISGMDPQEVVPDAIQEFSETIVQRWSHLCRRLIDGELIARGTTPNGEVKAIDALQWSRSCLSVDIKNGDLLEGSRKLWTGISLSVSRPDGALGMFHVEPTYIDHLRPATVKPSASAKFPAKARRARSRHKATAVAEALKLKGITDPGPNPRWTAIAGKIKHLVPWKVETGEELRALAKLVERHFQRK